MAAYRQGRMDGWRRSLPEHAVLTIPLHRRLLEAAGLVSSENHGPAKLADVTAKIQRALGRVLPPLAPGKPNPVAGIDVLNRLKIPSLDGLGRAAPAVKPMRSGTFASEAGTRPYWLFVPSHLPPKPALVVMLHGCTQSPKDFALGTRMNDLAEQKGFLVLYPEQVAAANAQRCWNWFNPADQLRGSGEPALIAGMTQTVLAEFDVDPQRVFAAGLSAGGAKAAILGATYPDLYAAIGVHSGLACGAAHDMTSAFMAMRQGRPGVGKLRVRTIVFHGDRDGTVNPANADALTAQLNDPGAPQIEHGQVPGGLAYTRTLHGAMLEQWKVHGAGHAWCGGDSRGSFTEPRGPDASVEMLRFFGV